MSQTVVAYAGGIPAVTGTVTLFNSATAYPPGGSFHLLGQQWFQYTLRTASDGGTATGTVTGSYSTDKGTTWLPFYSKSTTDADDDNAAAVGDVFTDEVYIGVYRDVRFTYTNAVEQLTVFDVTLTLSAQKPASKVKDWSYLVSEGILSAWYRNNTLSGAVSSVPDRLSPANPAVQSTAARQPTGNANGSISFDGNDVLLAPLHAGTAATEFWGCAFWLNLTSLAATRVPFSQTGGAGGTFSRGRLDILTTGAMQRTSGNSGVADFAAGTITAGVSNFITCEFDGSAASGSRLNMYLNGVRLVPTADGFAFSFMLASTGTWCLGAFDTGGAAGVLGTMGRSFFVFQQKMNGATNGLLTSAARAALMAIDPLP